MPCTKRMAPEFFEKILKQSARLRVPSEHGRFVRACEKIERQYKAIEAAALEVRRLWAPWAGEEGH